MPSRDVIVIGGSAGAVPALKELVRALPADLPAALFVALHVAPDAPGLLPEILRRLETLPSAMAQDGDEVLPGRILVAPPDHHLVIEERRVRVTRSPRVNRFRPSIDVMFRSAATSLGPRVAGVVLSGLLDDGTYGLATIKEHRGIAIVQDVAEATFSSMPRSAIDRVDVDHVLRVRDMPDVLQALARGTDPAMAGKERQVARQQQRKRRPARGAPESAPDWLPGGELTAYGCPDCGGALLASEEAGLLHFRCRIGHGYTAQSLQTSQEERLEDALWTAVRALEESAALRRRMAERVGARGAELIAGQYAQLAADAEAHAATLRALVESGLRRASQVIASDPLVRAEAARPARHTRAAGATAVRTRRRT